MIADRSLPLNSSCAPIGRARGFTLIEALVAVLILSIGLLGMSMLQLRTLANNQSSLQRSEAVFLSYWIIDSMRADRTNALSGSYAIDLDDNSPSATNFASTQLNEWRTLITNLLGSSATGAVTYENSDETIVTVTVQWDDSRGTQMTADTSDTSAKTQSLETEVRL